MPQSLAKVYLHAIFSTKNREPVLHDDGLARADHEACEAKERELPVRVRPRGEQGGARADQRARNESRFATEAAHQQRRRQRGDSRADDHQRERQRGERRRGCDAHADNPAEGHERDRAAGTESLSGGENPDIAHRRDHRHSTFMLPIQRLGELANTVQQHLRRKQHEQHSHEPLQRAQAAIAERAHDKRR